MNELTKIATWHTYHSQKVLSENLHALESDELVHREVFAEVPPRVKYSLIEPGHSLQPVFDSMSTWGYRY